MNTYKMYPLAVTMGLLFSFSLPVQANPQASTGRPVFMPPQMAQPVPPQPAPNPGVSPVAPEYVQPSVQTPAGAATVATTGQPAEKMADNASGQMADTTTDVPGTPVPGTATSGVQNAMPQPSEVMPPVGAFGYADDPAPAASAYPAPAPSAPTAPLGPFSMGPSGAMPPMPYGYAPGPYAAQPYPPAPYPYPQWAPNQNNNNPFNNLDGELFSGQNPFTNPMDNEGYWANPKFRPWSSGPLAPNRWNNHPMNNTPWGKFPGWGDGFFGGFGPDNWKGITPWGNNVPFRWVDPAEPRESIANMWDDAINTPNNMGRMPPGWTAPYISVPNPVDVADEFEKNARRFPDEINNMIDIGGD